MIAAATEEFAVVRSASDDISIDDQHLAQIRFFGVTVVKKTLETE